MILQCRALQYALPNQVSYWNDDSYRASRESYWSIQQQTVAPSCVVSPRSTEAVSKAVRILSSLNTAATYLGLSPAQFAIRGGGHTPWSGSANIDEAVVLDLSAMKNISVNGAQTVTSLRPGLRWLDVYMKLDALGLSVSGGRVSDVGVAGLIIGGGISFFSARYGFACDNVEEFEVVLASGEIINASAQENSDLWLALKGGSNNFGIVTRFDVKTFRQERFWSGFIMNAVESRFDQFEAFETLNNAATYDKHAALINTYFWNPSYGHVVVNSLTYTKAEEYPETFKPFTDIQPQLVNTMRISNMSDFTIEMVTRETRRNSFVTITLGNDAALFEKVFDIDNATLQTVTDVPNLSWSMTFQAIPTSIRQHSVDRGGNSLGIPPSEGPLVLVLLTVSWDDAADDERIDVASKSWFNRIKAAANAMGLGNDWIYLNYAAPWQKPIDGYGAANKARLQSVSRKYDPSGLFQKAVPGGFKLF
ncbi:MAG: hypothetical protein M1837_000938 [Sclerophora amabilis]|nr:MAG: hypothetical protein M1837_000938 [Sclerophora amabilis]